MKIVLFTIFSGFRKLRFQCYSPQFKWNQVVLLLKRSWRLPFSSFKLLFKYNFKKPQKLGLIYLWKIVLFTIFCGFRKIRFQCYSTQFKWNQVVLLLKRSRRLALSLFKLSFKYHFRKPQKLWLIYLWKIVLFTIFCGFRKIRFQCYSPHFKWNQVVLLLKRWRRLALSSFKLSFKYYFRKPQKLWLIYLWKIVLLTIFCGFRKILFQCYSPQFKCNQVVLLLKRSRRLSLSSFKLSF